MIVSHAPAAPETPVRATGYDTAALLTTAEVAKLLRVSESWLRKQRYQGHGPRPILVGPRCIRYRPADIQAWLGERERASHRHAPAVSNPASTPRESLPETNKVAPAPRESLPAASKPASRV